MSSKTERGQPEAVVLDLPGLLVDPSWLAERLGHPGLRTVDLRDAAAYESGHIPGALHLDLVELGSRVGGCDSMLVPPEEFSRIMAERDISNGDTIAAYDDQWGLAAARLLWASHYYGHAEVAVLNGGWDRWRDEGGAASRGKESVTPGRFEARPQEHVYADTSRIAGRIGVDDAVLLDTRTSAEFDKGHLPGAVSWDWFNAVPAGSWDVSRDPDELRAEWGELGLDPSDEVTVYCGTGMRAAHTYLALRNAGFTRVRLYDGSWQEWSMKAEGVDGH